MDPAVDFVLVFSVDPDYNSPVRGLGLGQDQAVRAKRVDQVRDEFSRLVAVLQAADLTVTSRRGAKGTSTVLVFVKASEQRVREEATRERCAS